MPKTASVFRTMLVCCVIFSTMGLRAQLSYTTVDFQNPNDIYPYPNTCTDSYCSFPTHPEIVESKGVTISGGHVYIDYRSGAPVGYFASFADSYSSTIVQMSFPAHATDVSMDIGGWAYNGNGWTPVPLEVDNNGTLVTNLDVPSSLFEFHYQTVSIGQPLGQITVHAHPSNGGVFLINIDNIRYRIQSSDAKTELWATSYKVPSQEGVALSTGKSVKEVAPLMRMLVPLGAIFQLGLQQHRGTDPITTIPSLVTRGVAEVLPPQRLLPTATVDPKVLRAFKKDALLKLGGDTFMAVHLGKQDVQVIAPFANNVPPITVSVEIVKPTALGTRYNARDEYFTLVAHNSGIPPQFVKGQAHQEGAFGRNNAIKDDNYRYEPGSFDYDTVSGGPRLAYTDADWIRLRLDDARGNELREGRKDDISPRSIFWIRRLNPETNQVEDFPLTDDTIRNVTAKEIWDDNDTTHSRQNFSANTTQAKRRLFNAANSTALSFVAQTGLASTFGYQQVGWEEALNDRYWSGVTIPSEHLTNYKALRYLFDRDEYINVGGGSSQIGTNIAADKMVQYADATFTDFTDVEGDLLYAYWTYNRGLVEPKRCGKPNASYDECVLDKAFLYPPLSSQLVFP